MVKRLMPPNITVVSLMRDCEWRVKPFRDRFIGMAYPLENLRLIVVEGDSKDRTRELLEKWAGEDGRVHVVRSDTGLPVFGSVVHPERFRGLAQVINAGLDEVDLEWSDYVLVLPSDVLFVPEAIRELVARDVDIVAPVVYRGGLFYDTWAFRRLDGKWFSNFHAARQAAELGEGLVEMQTIGGMALIRAEVVKDGCRYGVRDVDRGFCEAARELGYRVWCDTEVMVVHPVAETRTVGW